MNLSSQNKTIYKQFQDCTMQFVNLSPRMYNFLGWQPAANTIAEPLVEILHFTLLIKFIFYFIKQKTISKL